MHTEHSRSRNGSQNETPGTRWRSAKVALGSFIILASLTTTVVSLAWTAGPMEFYRSNVFWTPPPYVLPWPLLSFLWQSAEFLKNIKNKTCLSAASHLICDLLLGVAGLVLAIPMLALTGSAVGKGWSVGPWLTLVFVWIFMAIIASACHLAIFVFAYKEVLRAYKAFDNQASTTAAAAPPGVEPSSKPLLAPREAGATHQLPSEVLTHERPQEFGDNIRAFEMPGMNSNVMGISTVSVGVTRRSNEQDSLQQDT